MPDVSGIGDVVGSDAFRPDAFWHLTSGVCLLLGRPGSDLLSHVLGRSTIGAEGFHGRVRDGIGCLAPRNDHQVIEEPTFAKATVGRRACAAAWKMFRVNEAALSTEALA